jgi:pyruvate/2-oxoglutarate dehydrogenase complex dihydrolipoamide acyltransferase (E2) component
MFTTAWVANLGSLKMDSVFHHLYEYGNAGFFCTIGQVVEEPAVRAGEVVPARLAHLRFSYDERIDDGMYAGSALRLLKRYVEDPLASGCELSPRGAAEAAPERLSA